ncbi:MAG: excinuclease ABC subunit UvrB [Planctomycetes bacterium]|nr:excinuclease ABC subunit UvrB [Planctomycetota bacterium]MCB9918665.1 excinuclease ABC subunit UvrB [Planctomycetota bacterium]
MAEQDKPFRIECPHEPAGDQPEAIDRLVRGLQAGEPNLTLLGVTGSGKTYTMAQTIARVGRPACVLAPNKTLAAQLYSEFKAFFPHNSVGYFISYYDYYQPEAYIPGTDTYIEKESTINEQIEKMRNAATANLLDRRDCIIVASVSCIYGLGSPQHYADMSVRIERGMEVDRDDMLRALTRIQYKRNLLDFVRGSFRVRGDVVEIFPSYDDERIFRVEFFGDEVEAIYLVDPLRGEVLENLASITIYPVSHYVTPEDRLARACVTIREELEERLEYFRKRGRLLEAQRLEQRTRYDLELLREIGFCQGIENYSRHLDGREPGEPPATLLNYFPNDFVFFIDESHVAVPQIGAMFRGDRARKTTLVEHGFRLPSAVDNRPLRFEEFERLVQQCVYVSATPGEYEVEKAKGITAEQVIRPTGLVDPEIDIVPAKGQVDHLLGEVRKTVDAGYRILVTTLTKRMAEELTDYYREVGVKVRYLHSDIDSLERVAILRDLRMGVFDVLVGINLLREGLDLPEVALVAVLDADKEGFLRSRTSLIQTCGRAARNVDGRVILYADSVTGSMQQAMDEMERRRAKQLAYNEAHGITPKTIQSKIKDLLQSVEEGDYATVPLVEHEHEVVLPHSKADLQKEIAALKEKMAAAARDLEFERAAKLRDELFRLERMDLLLR